MAARKWVYRKTRGGQMVLVAPPTLRQLEVLDAIESMSFAMKYPPTLEEVGEQLEMSKRGAHDAVQRLQRKELADWSHGKARTLRVTPKGLTFLASYRLGRLRCAAPEVAR